MKKITLSSERFWFILTLLSSFVILIPSLIFQEKFAQGDHGRDLYAFAMAAKGALPYRDYLWVYGPLMPSYYAFFLKFVDASILSVLLGETVLKLWCGVTFFLIMRQVTGSFWSHLCTLFFLCTYPFFFHTYTYTGGILLLLLVLLTLIKYIHRPDTRLLYAGALFIFLMNLVKLNIGLGILVSYIFCIFMIDRKSAIPIAQRKYFYILCVLGVPLLTFIIYFGLTAGLPDYMIHQCFPLNKIGAQEGLKWLPLPSLFVRLMWDFAGLSRFNAIILSIGLTSCALFPLRFNMLDEPHQRSVSRILLSLLIFALVLLQEFYFSAVAYRVLWALPAVLIMVFIMLWFLLKSLPKNYTVIMTILLIGLILYRVDSNFKKLKAHISPEYFLNLERGGIFLGNTAEWVKTVETTTTILERTLAKDELFFAFPYDPLYYYLLDRPSPTYQLVFFDYMMIPPEQDLKTIKDLEEKKIRLAICSNRIMSVEPGLGVFGKTNSPNLYKYLANNFDEGLKLGYWDREPYWNGYHGILFLKRVASP